MPAAATPPKPRWRVLLLAALTAVLALLLPTAPASATASSAAETRIGAFHPAVTLAVGVHECITAGQRPVRGPSQLQVVVGNCVAAEGVSSAAPSTFTRAEALSGRASSRAVNEIAESMRVNGWQGAPIDVVELQGQRIVVDGHHRLAAAGKAGIDVQYRVVDPSSVIGPGRYTSVDDILRSTYSVGGNRLR